MKISIVKIAILYLLLLKVDGELQPRELHVIAILVGRALGVMVEDDGELLGTAGLVEQVHCKLLTLASQLLHTCEVRFRTHRNTTCIRVIKSVFPLKLTSE